jgi:hypothetical protein
MPQVQHWGVTGWSTEWASLEQGDEDAGPGGIGLGFNRVVEPGVVYLRPPVADGWPAWSENPGSRQRRFRMAWPEDEMPEVVSVLGLYERLSSKRATLEPEDDALRQLDESILEAVRQMDRLHRAGGTLGFVQPDSVLFCRMRDASLQVVFPDVGFAWDEERGLREPRWIAEPQLDCLLEEGPRRHNAGCLAALRDGSARCDHKAGKGRGHDTASPTLAKSQEADVRIMARLIAVALAGPDEVRRWCGSGRAFLAMPGRDRAPDTMAPVWDQAITPVLLQKITTASDLLGRLELAPPSEHFLSKPPAPPPAWKVAVRRASPGLAGVAAIIALLLVAKPVFDVLFPPRAPHRLCNAISMGDPRFGQLDELEQARGRAQAGELAGVAAYWELLAAAEDLPPGCMAKLREEAAGMISAQALTVAGLLRDDPMPRSAQLSLLQEAYRLAAAADQASPGRCTRAVGLLLRQLEARQAVPLQAGPMPSRSSSPRP